jgi:hypothetical protein
VIAQTNPIPSAVFAEVRARLGQWRPRRKPASRNPEELWRSTARLAQVVR